MFEEVKKTGCHVMLGKFEKICLGFCGVAVLIVAILYLNPFGFWLPIPGTYPREFLQNSKATSKPPKSLLTLREGSETPVWTAVQNIKKKNNVIAKLKKADPKISSKDLQEKYMQIPRKSFEFIRNETNWLPELKQAKRTIHKNRDGTTSLEITNIKSGSVLTRVLGLEAGDRIELINGERCDFSEDSTFSHRSRAKEIFETIENGGSASVTIMRNNTPQQITFSLE